MRWLADIRAQIEHCIICLDGPPYHRATLYPEYKAKRAAPDPELNQVKRDVRARLDLDGYNVAQAPSFEADDLLATLAAHPDLSMCPDVRLYTADKDGAQCCTTDGRVSIYAYNGKSNQVERRDFAWVEKEFGVPPKDMALFQALMGDTSDCYPGIKSWGPAKAAKAIRLFGTLEKMRTEFARQDADCKAELKETPAVVRAFLEHHTEVPLYLELATLRTDVPIDVAPLLVKKAAQPLPVKTAPAPEPSDADDSEFYDDPAVDCDDTFAEQKRAELVDWNGTKVSEQDNARHAGNDAEVKANIEAAKTLAWYKSLPEKMSCHYHEDCAAADAAMKIKHDAGGPLPPTAHHVPKGEFGKSPQQRASEAMDRALAMGAPTAPAGEHPVRTAADAKATADALQKVYAGAVAPSSVAGVRNDSQKTEETCKVVPPKTASASATSSVTPAPSVSSPDVYASASVVPSSQGPKKERPEALATVPAPSWQLAVQPSTVAQVFWAADKLYAERALLQYADAGGAGGVALTIMRGRELGLGLAASLEAFHIVKNKPYPKAHFLQAMAERDPNCEWIMITSADDTHATIETVHKKAGHLKFTYTIEMARKAGHLTGSNRANWEKIPRNMLEARAKSTGSNRWYPGSTFGMPSVEEMQDSE